MESFDGSDFGNDVAGVGYVFLCAKAFDRRNCISWT